MQETKIFVINAAYDEKSDDMQVAITTHHSMEDAEATSLGYVRGRTETILGEDDLAGFSQESLDAIHVAAGGERKANVKRNAVWQQILQFASRTHSEEPTPDHVDGEADVSMDDDVPDTHDNVNPYDALGQSAMSSDTNVKKQKAAKAEKPAKAPRKAAKPEKAAKAPRKAAKPEKVAKAPRKAAKAEKPAKAPRKAAKPEKVAKAPRKAAKAEKPAKAPRKAAKAEKPAKPEKAANAPRKAARPILDTPQRKIGKNPRGYAENSIVWVSSTNPHRNGSKHYRAFELYKVGATTGELAHLGIPGSYISRDAKNGHIKLKHTLPSMRE